MKWFTKLLKSKKTPEKIIEIVKLRWPGTKLLPSVEGIKKLRRTYKR